LNSVLLDTSFLITFSDTNRPNHQVAIAYYKECIARKIPMYLSTIVISEFQVKQAINDLPLRNFIVLPFNVDHAMRCGIVIRQMNRDAGDDRVQVKDDYKLISQCDCESIDFIFSEDANTLSKYLETGREIGLVSAKSILLRNGLDLSWFENGQQSILS